MNRVNRFISHPSSQHNRSQAFFLAVSFTFVPCSAWGLPTSQAAIDQNLQTQQNRTVTEDVEAKSSPQQIPVQPQNRPASSHLDLDSNLIQSSPVLQRWLKQVPDVLADIKRDPSFRTRLRLGYSQFPSTEHARGINLGIEDLFVGRSGLTLSGNYQTAFNGQREVWGGDVRYYVRPLGNIINLAPVLGYRHLETTRYTTDGVHVGLRLLLVPSRTGAADLAVTQSWVAPGSENEVGLTTLSFGYAMTHNLRLSTDLQKQNSRFRSDSSVGIGLEWLF
ncbi:hypothetical protein C7B82_20700 [Stenomitos frigidus ULC18]|uniref:Uncharacterized protein n=1 Tax=Stenomitos frigidus ULC18 TaxID=2107698 RepID=A0A2T1E059_9CYAN|nr:hypothetical protein C7B82_20700 [Stenomitos frigidus ULC18]